MTPSSFSPQANFHNGPTHSFTPGNAFHSDALRGGAAIRGGHGVDLRNHALVHNGTFRHSDSWHHSGDSVWNWHNGHHHDGHHRHHGFFLGFFPGVFAWGLPWYDCLNTYSLAIPGYYDLYDPFYLGPGYEAPPPVYPTPYERVPNLPSEAKVEVTLADPGATIWLDDYRTSSTGTKRFFSTPRLEPGKSYSYTVTAVWNQDGKVVEQDRKVYVAAGRISVVDFTGAAPPAANRVAARP